MKLHIIIGLFFFSTMSMKGQITLEHTLDSVTFGGQFYCTDIGNNEHKYVFLDSTINGFHLYNMDMTHFMTVHVPVNGRMVIEFMAIYISRTLFDCDSTNIEYAFQSTSSAITKPFYVIRTDGTVLFQVDSACGPYAFGYYGGSIDIRPIQKTSNGTKLYLMYRNIQYGTGIRVYGLCGSLPVGSYDFSQQNKTFVNIYPNPTSQELNFEITPPNNMEEFQLLIFDTNAKVHRKEFFTSFQTKYSMDVSNMSSGTYLYSLVSKTKTYQSGKFILTK